MKPKALVLLSGGLDSAVAMGLMVRQGIALRALHCVSVFSDGIREGCCGAAARHAADHFHVPLHVVNVSTEFLALVKAPRYGYGTAMNPCRDCHIMIFKKAHALLDTFDASFIVTGETVGQRPMSQLKDTLRFIERQSGLEGRIVRPLSGKLLPPTIAEKEGIISRSLFLDIAGRSRTQQLALAKEFNLTSFTQPAGGCILTDTSFSHRLADAFRAGYEHPRDIILLRWGRHFRFSPTLKAIIGRDDRENSVLIKLARAHDVIVHLRHVPGPFLILQGTCTDEGIAQAASLVRFYSKYRHAETVDVIYYKKGAPEAHCVQAKPISLHDVDALRIG